MKLQICLLLFLLALQLISAGSSKSSAKSSTKSSSNILEYGFHCVKDNNNLCSTFKEKLANITTTLSGILDESSRVNFYVFVDDASKYRINTEKDDLAYVLKTDFTPLSPKCNLYSPYMNAKALKNTLSSTSKLKEKDFILLLNSFKSNNDYLTNLKNRRTNLITIGIFEGLYYLNKVPSVYVKEIKNDGFRNDPTEMANTLLNLRKDPYTIEYLATQNDYKYQKVIEDYKLSDVIKWKDTIVREGSEYFTKSKYKYKRIIAIGDIHGDYEKLKNVLRHAKLIDKNNKWIATDTALVQVGDLTDRGAGFKKIMELLKKLRDEAKKKKSAVFMLLGNHELFDMQAGYFVLQKSDFDAFGGYLERERALSMDDMYGQLLRKEMNVTMLIDDNLFVHAGLRYKYAKKGIDELNKRAHDILTNVPSFDELLDDYYNKDKTHPLYSDYVFDMIDGPLWTDFFSSAPSDEVCEELEKVLKVTKAKRMIVGHTIQDYGRIRTNCHKKLIFIDIALSNCIGDYFGYLEILNDKKQIWTRYE